MRTRSFFLTLVAAVSAFSLLATPAEAGAKGTISAVGTTTTGPPVLIDRPVLIDQSVFIDPPVFIQVLGSRLDLDYRGLDLDSAFDRGAIARIGPTGTGPTGPLYSAIPPL
jgi:hypothetical protein